MYPTHWHIDTLLDDTMTWEIEEVMLKVSNRSLLEYTSKLSDYDGSNSENNCRIEIRVDRTQVGMQPWSNKRYPIIDKSKYITQKDESEKTSH